MSQVPALQGVSLGFLLTCQACFTHRRFGSLQKAFRTVDEDRSGHISREELDAILRKVNLSSIRKSVLDHLWKLVDADNSGEFSYQEFARVMEAKDVYSMGELRQKAEVKDGAAEYRAQKKEAQRRKAAAVGMTVDEYCDYYSIKEIAV